MWTFVQRRDRRNTLFCEIEIYYFKHDRYSLGDQLAAHSTSNCPVYFNRSKPSISLLTALVGVLVQHTTSATFTNTTIQHGPFLEHIFTPPQPNPLFLKPTNYAAPHPLAGSHIDLIYQSLSLSTNCTHTIIGILVGVTTYANVNGGLVRFLMWNFDRSLGGGLRCDWAKRAPEDCLPPGGQMLILGLLPVHFMCIPLKSSCRVSRNPYVPYVVLRVGIIHVFSHVGTK